MQSPPIPELAASHCSILEKLQLNICPVTSLRQYSPALAAVEPKAATENAPNDMLAVVAITTRTRFIIFLSVKCYCPLLKP
jgi:hypothetical protein